MSVLLSGLFFPEPIQSVLEQLYADTLKLDPHARAAASEKGLVNDSYVGFYEAMADARLPVTPAFGSLLYILARSTRAHQIVEFGTSFGVSTIFLAAALRDNGGGRLITSELLPAKAELAKKNLTAAGLVDLVEFRVGDARQTFTRDLPEQVDLLLLDAVKNMYLDILTLVEPRLRPGSLVISDRSDLGGGDGDRAAEYLDKLMGQDSGYRMAGISTEALGRSFLQDVAVRI